MKKILSISAIFALFCASVFAGDIVIFDAEKNIGKVKGSSDKKTADFILFAGRAMDFIGDWDLTNNLDFEFEIENPKNKTASFRLKIFDDDTETSDGMNPFFNVEIPAKASGKFTLRYAPQPPEEIWNLLKTQGKLRAMRATPFAFGDRDFALSSYKNIKRIKIVSWSGVPFKVKRVVAKDSSARKMPSWYTMSAKEFFPFVDKYGQFKFKQWKGKIHSDEDLKAALEKEEKDLSTNKGSSQWSKFGGWAAGSKQEARGHFYVKKIDGKWWLVDPEGNVFWSHGVVRVTPSCAITPLDTREFYYENLPPTQGDDFSVFYTTKDELLAPYYVKRGVKKTYDFSAANIYRKYGKDWRKAYAQKAHQRLRSWGLNTIANSSDSSIFMMGKTPYIERFELKNARAIECYGGWWWRFRDPFDKSFIEDLQDNLNARKAQLDDQWCIGMFVDNEHHWGDTTFLAKGVLVSSETLVAKTKFCEDLKQKYSDIKSLNFAWKTNYADWNDFLKKKEAPQGALKADLEAFNAKIVEEYFKNVRSEFKKVAPNKLYMGCRFAGGANKMVTEIAAKYCDVMSFNRYSKTIGERFLPKHLDKPVMIGEFHFGALDRGLFHCGLVYTANQDERAQCYFNYVDSALRNPEVIGTHWHQFSDQALTGRFDGECFQVGLTDICDNPYPETISKIREVGYNMYQIRTEGRPSSDK